MTGHPINVYRWTDGWWERIMEEGRVLRLGDRSNGHKRTWLGGARDILPFALWPTQLTASVVLFPSFVIFSCCVLTCCAKECNIAQKMQSSYFWILSCFTTFQKRHKFSFHWKSVWQCTPQIQEAPPLPFTTYLRLDPAEGKQGGVLLWQGYFYHKFRSHMPSYPCKCKEKGTKYYS